MPPYVLFLNDYYYYLDWLTRSRDPSQPAERLDAHGWEYKAATSTENTQNGGLHGAMSSRELLSIFWKHGWFVLTQKKKKIPKTKINKKKNPTKNKTKKY